MRFCVNDDRVAWRVVDGEGVLLHAETSAYFGLNRTGTLIWQQLSRQTMSADDLAGWIRHRIPGAPTDLSGDLGAFLAQLSELDLLDQADDHEDPSLRSPTIEDEPDADTVYEPPVVMPFGELEKLILSGE